MNIYYAFILLALSFGLLFYFAEKFVDLSVTISAYFGIPTIVTGIVIVGFATSAPEFAVSILASVQGYSQIGFGNGFGSVICNESLALGLGFIAIGFGKCSTFNRKYFVNMLLFLVIGVAALFHFFADGVLSLREALFFPVCLVFYFFQVVRTSNKGKVEKVKPVKHISLYIAGFIFVLLMVVVLGKVVVGCAVYIAEFFQMSKAMIAVTIVALGTSLPEVITSFVASRKGHLDIAIGNIIGSDVLNIFGIVGISAIIHPISVSSSEISFLFSWISLIICITFFALYKGCKKPVAMGIIMVMVYFSYLYFA